MNRPIRILLVLSALSAICLHAEALLVSSRDDGCRVVVTPKAVQTIPLDQTYTRIEFEQSTIAGAPGAPGLPSHAVAVAVPPAGRVILSATASHEEVIENVRVPPVVDWLKTEGISETVMQEGDAYGASSLFPGSLISYEEPGWFGDLRVLSIRITPVQFDPANNRVIVYKRVQIDVRFENPIVGADFTRTPLAAGQEQILVNPDQARKWHGRFVSLRKTKSTFGSGDWYKIPVTEEGVYKITGKFLKDKGIDLGMIDPSTLKLYNNGGRMLPRNISTARPDGLIENPIRVDGVDDNRFDEGDAIVFYGNGVTGWEVDTRNGRLTHYNNIYDTENIYWLTFNDGVAGKRIETAASEQDATEMLNHVLFWQFFEQDIINPIQAGIRWYAYEFNSINKERTLTFSAPHVVQDQPVQVRIRAGQGTSGITHQMKVSLNQSAYQHFSVAGTSIREFETTFGEPVDNNELKIKIGYEAANQDARIHLDWVEIGYTRLLNAESNRLFFNAPLGDGGVYTWRLGGFSREPTMWDVTSPGEIQGLSVVANGANWQATGAVEANQSRRYAAFLSSAVKEVSSMRKAELAALRHPVNGGADYVIITHRDFWGAAQTLKTHRQVTDTMAVLLVDIQDVYDTFSGGLMDPVAIRDFMAVAYQWPNRPEYLILIGDGNWDYRNTESDPNNNRIPVYQIDAASHVSASAVDDFYVYVHGNDTYPDIAVGRLPVRSAEEAQRLVDRIIGYETRSTYGHWRNHLTFVADDIKTSGDKEDSWESSHTLKTDRFSRTVIHPQFDQRKIFLLDYPEVMMADGRRKPEAREDIVKQINLGTLHVNYIGHGNPNVWAHENVFVRVLDIPRLTNADMLPLIYGATCNFAEMDMLEARSMAEELVLHEGGGAVATIGATRECFASPNELMNSKFLSALYGRKRMPVRAGEALRLAKLSGSPSNDQKYVLLGDPALKLNIPDSTVVVQSLSPDSLQALAVTTVRAKVETGASASMVSGNAYVQVFDSEKKRVFQFESFGATVAYHVPGNALFRGEAPLSPDGFQARFIVPRDIGYGGRGGRLSIYASNQGYESAGFRDSIYVGGSADIHDTQGPDIRVWFDGYEGFVTGGLVGSDPVLIVEIEDDKTGVNITGEIGHKLMLTIDQSERLDVTEYFQYDENSYLKGKIRYPMHNLSEGMHALELKVWDNANNSSTIAFSVKIVPRDELRLEQVLNYPNPMTRSTHFTFQLNQPAEVVIKIFAVDGRMVRKIENVFAEPGFNMIPWDGTDHVGDDIANGVYLYKVDARADHDGKALRANEVQRLLVAR